MKDYKKTIIITTLVTLLPILLGIILWEKLPDSIATHWGADGQADGWSNKAFAVFGLPCILAVIHLFSVCVMLNDPKRKNIHKKPLTLIFWIVPVVSFVTNGFTYAAALGSDMDISLIISILIGSLFIILGNYMPKLQQNYTVGIKLPLDSEQHRELEPDSPLGRETFYRRRRPDRCQRFSLSTFRRDCRAHYIDHDHPGVRCNTDGVFILAIQERDLNLDLCVRTDGLKRSENR